MGAKAPILRSTALHLGSRTPGSRVRFDDFVDSCKDFPVLGPPEQGAGLLGPSIFLTGARVSHFSGPGGEVRGCLDL